MSMATRSHKSVLSGITGFSARPLCLLGLVLLALSACDEPRNFDLTTNSVPANSVPVCTAAQIEDLSFIQEFQVGVAGRDPVGEHIYRFPKKDTTFEGGPWVPYWPYKTTLCGTLTNFNFNDTWFNEDDWNNYIVPLSEERFSSLLSVPLSLAFERDEQEEFHTCRTGPLTLSYCMEGEITPDQAFFGNQWFPRVHGNDDDSSYLEGHQLCTYGPYVADAGHGARPEIHPSELYWFREPGESAGGTLTTLMLLQDDSERFEEYSNFDFGSIFDLPPDDWRPWAAYPRTGEFSLAFRVTIDPLGTGERTYFDISEAFPPRNVVTTGAAALDSDDGTEHALTYNGQTVVRVRELQSQDQHVGVRFEDVCWIDFGSPNRFRLQGYVTLTSMVGEGDDGGEGYQVLTVHTYPGEQPDPPPVLQAVEPILPIPFAILLRETLHPADVNADGSTELLADVHVTLRGNPGVSESALRVVNVEWVAEDERRALSLTHVQQVAGSSESQVFVEDVSVANGANLELTTESGEVIYLSAPPVALAPTVIAESPVSTVSDSLAWDAMVAAVGGNVEESTRPLDILQRVSEWQLEVTPLYAPFKQGQAYREDESPVAAELNELVSRGDPLRLEGFFGSDSPFSVEWTYEARNLTTGEVVLVNTTGNATSNEVQVQILSDESLTESLVITFPEEPADALFQLTATARMTDTLGNVGEVSHMLWSHVLTGEDSVALAENTIFTAANLAGISPDELLEAGQLALAQEVTSRIPPEPRQRIAGMLPLLAAKAAEDQRISVSELASLIRGARLFGSQ